MRTIPTVSWLLSPMSCREQTLGNRILREALGGWQINSIATFESGSPTTVFNGYTSSYDGMGDVPLQTCNGNLARGKQKH